jgi:undecaprenyl-diphosphatase
MTPLSVIDAVVLGIVEGITEFLPISSTGHLLVTQHLLGLGDETGKVAADTYAIAIQLGAILAVIALYRMRIASMAKGAVGKDAEGRSILTMLVCAFLPAAVIGLAFGDSIKDKLFTPWAIVVAWAAGGIFLLWWKPAHGTRNIAEITLKNALIIGVAQSLAMWPGVSRSLVTIVAALLVGCSMAAALEFSFLLGLATLTAATALDLAKNGDELVNAYGWGTPILGAVVAFATAVIAVKWLVRFLAARPLAWFGWYRLAAAGVAMVLIISNTIG